MNLPFSNNLVRDDVVMHAQTKRVGKVSSTPTEGSRLTGVIWQGTKSPQYTDVMLLRLVINGTPEDVAPVDGEPPELLPDQPARGRRDPAPEPGALAVLKRDREAVDTEMKSLEARFKTLKSNRERIDAAISILAGTAQV